MVRGQSAIRHALPPDVEGSEKVTVDEEEEVAVEFVMEEVVAADVDDDDFRLDSL